jgi:aspartyl-tRNA(Asn)/glutamyl-tRNA(Gln) amidotransferase subunit B
VLRALKERGVGIEAVAITPAALGGLIRLVDAGTISSTVAKGVFETMYDTGRGAREIVEAEGLAQIADTGALQALVSDVLAAQPDAVAQYRAGKTNALGFMVGQVMRASKGKANPAVVNDLLKAALAQ